MRLCICMCTCVLEGYGPDGIKNIKAHAFFKVIDWDVSHEFLIWQYYQASHMQQC